jgi:hypothetical protein
MVLVVGMQVEVRSFLLRGGRGVIRLLRKNDGVVKDGFRLFDEGVGLWVYFPPPPPLVLFAFSFLLSSVDFAFTEAFPLGFSVFPCFCFGLVSFLERWKNCCIYIFSGFSSIAAWGVVLYPRIERIIRRIQYLFFSTPILSIHEISQACRFAKLR